MKVTTRISKSKKDHYHISIKTYNGEISGRFEKSEVRELIQILDNAIL